MRLQFLIALLALAPGAFAHDWLIVPGKRVGPIGARTVPADLSQYFAKGDIENGQIELDEGAVQLGTFVYKSTPSQTLAIVWDKEGADAHPKQIFICFGRRRGECRWQTDGGIRVGTRLAALESMNGKPFTVSGFGWNYGGNVLSWEGGKLSKLDCNGKLVLTLDGERKGIGEYTTDLTREEQHSISGDKSVPSSTPAMKKLNPSIVGMLFQFPGPGDKTCQ